MRILFTTVQRHGHLQMLVPLARAAAAAGHVVAFACAASFRPHVERAGFAAFPAGFDERGRAMPELYPGLRAVPLPAVAEWWIPRVAAGLWAAAMTPDLLTIAREWRADLVVRDAMEYGGCLAAEVLGLPHAVVRTGSTTSRYGLRQQLVAGPLARLRELNGLPPDPDCAMPFRYLHLAAEPPGFGVPGEVPAPTTHYLRPIEADRAGDETLPTWVAPLPDRPTVHASVGTVFGAYPEGRAIVAAILAALREEPLTLIVTVGPDADPAQYGPQPAHVHLARYIPHSALLPRCAVFITHGGYGSVMAGLNAGVPLVVLPISADQPYNAACCAALGVGTVVEPDDRTPEAIREAVRLVLSDPSYRAQAERVRDAMAALPGPEYGVYLLERLAAEQRPLLRE